ncbi:nineteen complex-related protein 2-domain-containing protein [Whalleya microplaca]|nr:nineteen complex-related protein 2-domain-containing protein [Whalleya microplaca]
MSSFGAKRRARKITVQDDDEDTVPTASLNPPPEPQEPALQPTFKTNRKPFKHSSLRKSFNPNDDEQSVQNAAPTPTKPDAEDDEDEGGAPLRIRLPLGRSGSTKSKKATRASTSRLSFGPSDANADGNGDDDAMVLGDEVFTPRKPTTASSLAHAAAENSTYKKGSKFARNPAAALINNRLPLRSADADDGRPRYSKEYLSELQSSTPNTPRDLSKLHLASDDDEMALDPSELEGAMIVDTAPASAPTHTAVLTEAEIQEKKARRARLAQQHGSRDTEDFISLSDDERGAGDSYLSVLSRQSQSQYQLHTKSKSKSEGTRLVREDEDLGEGFDEFVEDSGLSLGRKAEREARRRQRAEMASLITTAEGGSGPSGDDASDDSEAERRAAYERAQTRAGMDGLAAERAQQQRRLRHLHESAAPPRITPLPDLSVLVAAFKARMRDKEEEMVRLRARIAELKEEREGVLRREPEVQRLLDEAGERYRALMMPSTGGGEQLHGANDGEDGEGGYGGEGSMSAAERNIAAAKSLLGKVRGNGADTPGQRGLESLGTTPVKQSQMEI